MAAHWVIKMTVKEIGHMDLNWIHLAQWRWSDELFL